MLPALYQGIEAEMSRLDIKNKVRIDQLDSTIEHEREHVWFSFSKASSTRYNPWRLAFSNLQDLV
jgi:hypothetical protein